jgi:hypothetical protein
MVVPGMNLVERAHEQKTHISEICTHNAYDCGAYLFGILKVLKQRILAPDDSLLLVRLRVFETCCLAGMPTEQTIATSRRTSARRAPERDGWCVIDAPMKVRSDFVTFARAGRMALSTARLEKLSTSLRVTL